MLNGETLSTDRRPTKPRRGSRSDRVPTDLRDRGRECRLAVIDVADRADVEMRLRAVVRREGADGLPPRRARDSRRRAEPGGRRRRRDGEPRETADGASLSHAHSHRVKHV